MIEKTKTNKVEALALAHRQAQETLSQIDDASNTTEPYDVIKVIINEMITKEFPHGKGNLTHEVMMTMLKRNETRPCPSTSRCGI